MASIRLSSRMILSKQAAACFLDHGIVTELERPIKKDRDDPKFLNGFGRRFRAAA
jgi:hypothetical protein